MLSSISRVGLRAESSIGVRGEGRQSRWSNFTLSRRPTWLTHYISRPTWHKHKRKRRRHCRLFATVEVEWVEQRVIARAVWLWQLDGLGVADRRPAGEDLDVDGAVATNGLNKVAVVAWLGDMRRHMSRLARVFSQVILAKKGCVCASGGGVRWVAGRASGWAAGLKIAIATRRDETRWARARLSKRFAAACCGLAGECPSRAPPPPTRLGGTTTAAAAGNELCSARPPSPSARYRQTCSSRRRRDAAAG